jgi:hypothetical protein
MRDRLFETLPSDGMKSALSRHCQPMREPTFRSERWPCGALISIAFSDQSGSFPTFAIWQGNKLLSRQIRLSQSPHATNALSVDMWVEMKSGAQ